MNRKKRIGVLYGGQSAEHEISVRSAKTILRHFPTRFQPVPIYITRSGRWKLQRRHSGMGRTVGLTTEAGLNLIKGERLAAIFPVLHGPMGEDGTIQGLFELAGIPYVGCGVLTSAVAMNKEATKIFAHQAGIPQLPYKVLTREETPRSPASAKKTLGRLGLPVFVKPLRMGSSVGVSKVKAWSRFAAAAKEALRFDDKIVVEKGIDAREIECSVIGDGFDVSSSVPGEIKLKAEWYDYKTKYLSKTDSETLIPAPISKAKANEVRRLAEKAFKAVDGNGLARVDFLLARRGGRIWFNEINTLPGFTSISMFPMMWEASGLNLQRLIGRLIDFGFSRQKRKRRLSLRR